MREAHTVQYKDDDGNWCYALVASRGDNSEYNLIYKAHTGSGWEVANGVPSDSERIK